MSRDDGFAVMDVSTDLVNDPKVRKLFRHAPDHAACAFLAYIATVAESWKAGRRVNVDDAWPGFVPFDKAAMEALVEVGLLDRTGRVTVKAWRGWYGVAHERRDASREKWRRVNGRRKGKDEALETHGSLCGICHQPIDLALRYPHPMSFTVDHIVPVMRGGPDVPENRQPAHLECNLVKGDREGYHRGKGVVTTPSSPSVPSVPSSPPVPPVRPSSGRANGDDGSKSKTREEALLALSEKFQRNEIDELTYSRQRKALAS